MPYLSLILSSLFLLVLENLLALLMITMHGPGSCEAGIGQARACPARPGTPACALTPYWVRQSGSSTRRLRPPLHLYLCIELLHCNL
jgi:hypothetical protein